MRIALLALLLAIGCTRPGARGAESETNEVTITRTVAWHGKSYAGVRVRFSGNEHLAGAALVRDLDVAHGFVEDSVLLHDASRIELLYWDQGYLQVKVEPNVQPVGELVEVTFVVREGVQFRLGALDVYEDLGGQHAPALGWVPRVKVGDVFSRKLLRQSIEGLERTYRDLGFAFVMADPSTKLDLERRTVGVTLAVVRGPLVHLHTIEIVGLKAVAEAAVRAELLVHAGDLYSETKLEKSRQRLLDTGWFSRVDLATKQAPAADEIDLIVEVDERPKSMGAPSAANGAEPSTTRPFWAILAAP